MVTIALTFSVAEGKTFSVYIVYVVTNFTRRYTSVSLDRNFETDPWKNPVLKCILPKRINDSLSDANRFW